MSTKKPAPKKKTVAKKPVAIDIPNIHLPARFWAVLNK